MRPAPALLVAFAAFGVALSAATPDPTTLVRGLGDSSSRRREDAARGLLSLGAAASPALAAAATSPDPEVRARARALAAIVAGDADIRRRLADDAVLDALLTDGGLEPGAATDARVASLMPESGRSLAAAARRIAACGFVPRALVCALARHATPESVSALAEFVRDGRVFPSAALRAARGLDATLAADRDAAESLRAAAGASLPALEEAMRSAAPSTRRAALALHAALAADAFRLAEMSLDRDADVRAEAARAMGLYAPSESASTLRELASDPIAAVREAALTALLRVPGAPHPEPAVLAADDGSPAVRAAAARLLARDATPDSLGVLDALASDASPRVRAEAGRSLAALRR